MLWAQMPEVEELLPPVELRVEAALLEEGWNSESSDSRVLSEFFDVCLVILVFGREEKEEREDEHGEGCASPLFLV